MRRKWWCHFFIEKYALNQPLNALWSIFVEHQSMRSSEITCTTFYAVACVLLAAFLCIALLFDHANESCNFNHSPKKKNEISFKYFYLMHLDASQTHIRQISWFGRFFFFFRMLIELHLSKSRSKACSSLFH